MLPRSKNQRSFHFESGAATRFNISSHEDDLADLIFWPLGSGLISPPEGVITAAHDQGWKFRGILEHIAASKGKKVRFLPIPWRMLWAALKVAETLHVPVKFRSDSVVSLVNQNPHPSFKEMELTGIKARPFRLSSLRT